MREFESKLVWLASCCLLDEGLTGCCHLQVKTSRGVEALEPMSFCQIIGVFIEAISLVTTSNVSN